jgi:hypothetical protein
MRYTSDDHRRYAFRNWLRDQLAALDFYQRRGDRFLVSEFARYAASLGARVEEVSLGRYLRNENPVLPTPESCRELARALGRHPTEVLLEAGYLSPEDFYFIPSVGVTEDSLRDQIQVIDTYTYVPEPIREQMKNSLQKQLEQLAQLAPTRSGAIAAVPTRGAGKTPGSTAPRMRAVPATPESPRPVEAKAADKPIR